MHIYFRNYKGSSLKKHTKRHYYYSTVNNLSNWDVSNVKDMIYMFSGSIFDGDISMWTLNNQSYLGIMNDVNDFKRLPNHVQEILFNNSCPICEDDNNLVILDRKSVV